MNVRRATEADEAAIRELWEEFEAEVPEPDDVGPGQSWQAEWADVCANIAAGAVYLAEDDDGMVGMARATAPDRRRSHLVLAYVRPRARRRGVAKALVRACVQEVKAQGSRDRMSLSVLCLEHSRPRASGAPRVRGGRARAGDGRSTRSSSGSRTLPAGRRGP